jgi:threonine/homoserine/homoserine lactone efflux protein
VMGLTTSGLIHEISNVPNVSTVFSYSPALHTVVKIIGPANFIYLGVSYSKLKTIRKNKTEK